MPARTLRLGVLIAAVATLAAMATPISAAPSVSIGTATVSGGTATITGTATFPAITTPQTVQGDESVLTAGTAGGTAAGDTAGLNLTDGAILPLSNSSGLRFIWTIQGMPPQVPPEGVRYTWAFKIGTNVYQLQAKSTNMASVTTLEQPVGHIQRLQSQQPFFQLRGACAANYLGTPSNGCYHLAWLNGTLDTTAGKVTVDLPYNTKDEIGRLVAPDFVPGTVLEDNGGTNTAGMVVAACFQAVLNTADMCRYINGINKYYTGPQVHLAVGAAGAAPEGLTYGTAATLSGGSFSGSVSGLGGNVKTVYVRACNGTECSYTSQTVL